MAEESTYNYSGVIKMSVNTNILAEQFVFSLRYCRLAVKYTESITELVVYEHKHCQGRSQKKLLTEAMSMEDL